MLAAGTYLVLLPPSCLQQTTVANNNEPWEQEPRLMKTKDLSPGTNLAPIIASYPERSYDFIISEGVPVTSWTDDGASVNLTLK